MKIYFLSVFSVTSQHKTLNDNIKLDHTSIDRKHKTETDLSVGESKPLLDNSAQKHKLSVKPKKRHASSAHRSISEKKFTPKPGER